MCIMFSVRSQRLDGVPRDISLTKTAAPKFLSLKTQRLAGRTRWCGRRPSAVCPSSQPSQPRPALAPPSAPRQTGALCLGIRMRGIAVEEDGTRDFGVKM